MKIKRLITTCMLASCVLQYAAAMPADPRQRKVRQADGSYITIVVRGDEHGHQAFTLDGQAVKYNKQTGMFEPSVIEKTSSKLGIKRSSDDKKRILISNYPTKGKQKSLVILMEFSDTKFSSVDEPYQFYTDMLNKEGFTWTNGANGSARDFYLDSSSGQFDPTFVVVGPAKLSHNATYYGSDDGGQDVHMAEAIKEACDQLDDKIDFSEYDTDGDGYVDNIFFFYSGYGQADTPIPDGDDYIWPHSAFVEEAWKVTLTYDGKKIGNYACSNEIKYTGLDKKEPAGIGIFVHEFGHVLGLADHYDVTYDPFTFGLDEWDTMASGGYNNDLNTPPAFSAFERAELKWLDYTDLNINADSISVLPDLNESNKAYRIAVPGNENEYYILENRQQKGWDTYLPGHGMLTWHIDMDTTAWIKNTVNTDRYHQRVDIVEVDGKQSEGSRSGDIMPGTAYITKYTLNAWDDTHLVDIDDVAENNDTISLLLADTKFSIASPTAITVTAVQDSSFTASWDRVGNASYYLASVYTIDANGQKVYVKGMQDVRCTEPTISVDSLSPDTPYYIYVKAGRGSYTSDEIEQDVKTQKLAFTKRKSAALTATDITETGFTAGWQSIEDADNYSLTLYKHDYSSTLKEQGYDFYTKSEGMPLLWETSGTMYYSVSGYYGATPPSLRFTNTDNYLIIAYPEAKIEELSFWYRSRVNDGMMYIDTYDGTEWKELTTIAANTTGETVKLPIVGGADKIRMRYERVNNYMVVDDIVTKCTVMERNPVDGMTDILTGNNLTYTLTGLQTGATYSFRVTGLSGSERSYMSDECSVTLQSPNAITNVYGTNDKQPVAYYDINGRKLSDVKGNNKKGITIVVYSDGTRKKIVF